MCSRMRCERTLACMHACVHDVFAIYDDNILSRLIMIIIKIIILYFIQISHNLKSQKRTSPYPPLLESILVIHCFDSSAVVTLMVFCLSFFLFEIEPGHTSVRNW